MNRAPRAMVAQELEPPEVSWIEYGVLRAIGRSANGVAIRRYVSALVVFGWSLSMVVEPNNSGDPDSPRPSI